ncbi:hypothetical protein E4U21_003572 [Claviceps maximensis]|nr:hypothetical protein E4U21_003572 [Claviceps maximensis]
MQLIANLALLLLPLQAHASQCDGAASSHSDASAPPAKVSVKHAAASSDPSCPPLHIFGARGTGIPPGYDLLLPLIEELNSTYHGTTTEAIQYPACGGGAACGGLSYGESVKAGTAAVAKAVNDFHARCPKTKFVLMGYSQGGHIIDDALCGGQDPNAQIPDNTPAAITSSAAEMIQAVTFMGSPRYQAGLSYETGTCTNHGFDHRPAGFKCSSASKIQSYCDGGDPYCCLGQQPAVHGSYVQKYGKQAVSFIQSKLSGQV